MAESIPPALIEREREAGWPTIHPEDYCHWCGSRNMLWFAAAIHWNTATADWTSVTGRDGICCPQCFADMHAEATGERLIWEIRPWIPESPDLGSERDRLLGDLQEYGYPTAPDSGEGDR